MLILWSLSDSLYSIETIQGLRFLSNGEELAYFGQVPVETVAVRPSGVRFVVRYRRLWYNSAYQNKEGYS